MGLDIDRTRSDGGTSDRVRLSPQARGAAKRSSTILPDRARQRYGFGKEIKYRPAHRGYVGLHQAGHHLQAGADREGEQALTHVLGDLAHRYRPRRRVRRALARYSSWACYFWYLLVTVVPFLVGVLATPNTYPMAGFRRGTAT